MKCSVLEVQKLLMNLSKFHSRRIHIQHYKWREEFIDNMLWNYAYLNSGLTLKFNGKSIRLKRGF